MKPSSPAAPGRRASRREVLSRAEEAALKSRSRPMLEGPGLVMWLVIADALLVHIFWLLTHIPYMQAAMLHLALISVATFFFFGLDKWRARRNKRRVSEANLIALSVVGGAVGGILGMAIFRHKLNRMKFRIALPLALFLHVALLLVMNFTEL